MDFSILELLKLIPEAGAGLMALVVVVAIYFNLKKVQKADSAEGNLYELLTKEVIRLSKSLEESDKNITELRKLLAEERKKCDRELNSQSEEIKELRNIVESLSLQLQTLHNERKLGD